MIKNGSTIQDQFLLNKSQKKKLYFFARANILHKEKNYTESAKYLEIVNKLKLEINPFNFNSIIKTDLLLTLTNNKAFIDDKSKLMSIFIVGMSEVFNTNRVYYQYNENIYDLEKYYPRRSILESQKKKKEKLE